MKTIVFILIGFLIGFPSALLILWVKEKYRDWRIDRDIKRQKKLTEESDNQLIDHEYYNL